MCISRANYKKDKQLYKHQTKTQSNSRKDYIHIKLFLNEFTCLCNAKSAMQNQLHPYQYFSVNTNQHQKYVTIFNILHNWHKIATNVITQNNS